MTRVQHPAFPLVVNTVPDADADDWIAAGWLPIDARRKRTKTPETPGE
jgi:hypothetical protein